MSPIKLVAAIVLFGLTLAFAVAGTVTAVYGLRYTAPVLGNAALFLLGAIVVGTGFLALARSLTRERTQGELVTIQELFQDAPAV